VLSHLGISTMLLLPLLLPLTLVANLRPADKPLPPAEAPKAMTLPAGFKVTLFAGEPDVVQPIACAFDDRGRLWVVECLSYPQWTDKKEGNDRVVIFEDTVGDGSFHKKTVFWDKGRNLSGIEIGFGGVWLCSTPELIFLPFKEGEDHPSGPPQAVLDGWNLKEAKHNVFNSLVWGPDGWLWGCNGIQSQSSVGAPGTPSDKRVSFNCGVWRYHPTRKTFEAVAHGTTNPWGLDFDDYGEAYITNCVIHHLWHVVPGAHFERMYGQDIDPHSYGLLTSIADYIHWAGGNWTESRGGQGAHSDAGGGHAHVGAAIYLGPDWPAEYRNSLFTCNLHGNRLNRDRLEYLGSGTIARRAPDFLFAHDPWFRGLAVKQGPDDSLYVSDWCDTGECHNYVEVDRSNGRVYKVTYGTPKPFQGNLARLSDAELVKLQLSPNDWLVRHARRLLQERAAAGTLDPHTKDGLWEIWEHKDATRRLRALWALHAIGEFRSNGFAKVLWHADWARWDEHVRGWVVRLAFEDANPPVAALAEVAGHDRSLVVRLALASGLQRLPAERRWDIAAHLVAQADSVGDRYLPLMTWYAVSPLAAADPARAGRLLATARIPLVRENLARRLATLPGVREPLVPLVALLNEVDGAVQADILAGMQQALVGRRSAPRPSGWEPVYARLSASPSVEVRRRALTLAVVFDDPTALASLRSQVLDPKLDSEVRRQALQPLVTRQRDDLLPLLLGLLDDPVLRGQAVRALAAFADPKTPDLLLKRYSQFPPEIRTDVIATLSSRPAYALALLDAVEKESVPRTDLSAFTIRQLGGLKNAELNARLLKVWGNVRPASQERVALTARYKKELNSDVLKKADRSNGHRVFKEVCASCHKLFDDGGDAGPELTGSQRANLDYVLENVLDPSAVVARDYQMSVIMLKNGRVLNGIVKREDERSVTLRTQNETLVVPKVEIDTRTLSPLSLMPDGLLDKLSRDEVRDLIAYLASPEQVPLPK
jgi:putative membrane-bound dehydrogenase-like protein